MTDTIESHSDIGTLWPRPCDFARAVGVPYNITRKWMERDRIPAEYWVRVVKACHEIDAPVTFKLLAELIDEKKSPSQ